MFIWFPKLSYTVGIFVETIKFSNAPPQIIIQKLVYTGSEKGLNIGSVYGRL